MNHLHDDKIKELEEMAQKVRVSLVNALVKAGSGHTAGPLGMAEIFTYLYFHALKHDPKNPTWPERDYLVLSNGHICPVLYSTMAHAGYFPVEDFENRLRAFGSPYQGHPHREYLPSLETSSGPLGSGLSQAIGMAFGLRMDYGTSSDRFVYCLMSDGELDAGNTWEGAMLAGREKLHNVIAIIDRNNIQIDGYTEDIMPLEPLREKWEAWNWHVQEIDGHNFEAIHEAVGQAKSVFEKPSVIIAHTVPGKGVSFAERKFSWHGSPPGQGPEDNFAKKDQADAFLNELRTLGGAIKGEHE
ncbi:MAG: transketolase [Candidatus Vogelbacteria bacterium]|nr:transketolase [Candidatus Vogelbacteria bacterium]